LKRFVTPSQRAQEKFYEIYQSPTSSAIAQFKNSYPAFKTLAQLGPILMGDKKIRNDIMQNAEIGDAESNLLIGLIYSKPNTLPYIKTNLSTAKNYFKKASDEGYSLGSVFYAQALSCTIMQSGCNKLRSERLFKDSDLELGNFLQAELLVKSGKADAASRLLKKSSLSGSSFGMNLLGEIEYKKGNIQKSLDYFLIAANQGNAPATISLAAIDPSSTNIKKLKSFYYLGSKEAGISLALSIQGSDPEGFFDLSKELAKSAPEDGNLLLAIAYLNGSGTKVSAVNATASLKKCASNTNCKILSTISSSDSGSVKSKNLKSLIASVESNSASANVIPSILGSAYSMLGQIELKAGKPKSSISFFENGARLNDIDSMISLCDIYLYNNSQRNVKNARTYCMQAYNQGTKNPFVLNTLGSLALGTWGEKYEKSSALKYFKESCSLNSGIGCCNSALTSTKTNDKTSFIKKAKKYGYQCDL
jgi:TPR repeat protein